jgi:hypothetical protein
MGKKRSGLLIFIIIFSIFLYPADLAGAVFGYNVLLMALR